MRNRGTAAGVPGEQTHAFSTPYEKTSPSKTPTLPPLRGREKTDERGRRKLHDPDYTPLPIGLPFGTMSWEQARNATPMDAIVRAFIEDDLPQQTKA